MSTIKERRIYCKYDGSKLTFDHIGPICPTRNCKWHYGIPDAEAFIVRKAVVKARKKT